MKLLVYFVGLCMILAYASSLNDEHINDPSYYRCPFRMFNMGLPVVTETGEVMYCDVDGASCPQWHFCAYGYDDGRSVCCHILGV